MCLTDTSTALTVFFPQSLDQPYLNPAIVVMKYKPTRLPKQEINVTKQWYANMGG